MRAKPTKQADEDASPTDGVVHGTRDGGKTQKLGLSQELSVGEALQAFTDDILGEARAALTRPDKSDAVAVHDFRKAIKRWRAFLRLIEPAAGSAARLLRIEARDVARAMAAARDYQAALDALSDIEKNGTPEQPSFAGARKRIAQQRETAEVAALNPFLRERAARMLDGAERVTRLWAWPQMEFAQVADGLTIAYRRARKAMPADWRAATEEELHNLRGRVIVHRYQMQLVEPLWPRFGKLWTGEAQRVRERLGARQDLAVLLRLTEPHGLLAPWRSRLTPLIDARVKAHVDAAAKVSQRIFAERPRAFTARLQALWDAQHATPESAEAQA